MATTALDLITRAVATSFKNRADTIANHSLELTRRIDARLKALFGLAAEVNPMFFGAQVAVTGVVGAWTRPTDAEIVVRIEYNVAGPDLGQEIIVVPYDDRDSEPNWSVYQIGQAYIRTATTLIADNSSLVFWYARRPTTLVDQTSVIDGVWPESYNDLLMLPLAAYLARKDGRIEEANGYDSETQALEVLFTEFLKRHQSLETRRTGWPRLVAPTTIKAV